MRLLQPLLLLLLLLLRADDVLCDARIQGNVRAANTSELLESIRGVELKYFEYLYEQFYNPVFGKEQLGVVAQELRAAVPQAVGLVEKRRINTPKGFVDLENLHVVNPDVLYMSNIGATQELHKRLRSLHEDFDKTKQAVATDLQPFRTELKRQVDDLVKKQIELESSTRLAQANGETLAKQLSESELQHGAVLEIIKSRADALADELKTIDSEHRKASTELEISINNQVAQARKDVDAQIQQSLETAKQAAEKLNLTELQVSQASNLTSKVAATVEALKQQIQTISDRIDVDMEGVNHTLESMRKTQAIFEFNLTSIQHKLAELHRTTEKLAGEELVEQRKLAEAQAEIARAQIEQERVKAEEQRKTADHFADLELEKQKRQDNATVQRLQLEQSIRAESELALINARKEAALAQEKEKSQQQQAMILAQTKADVERIQAERAVEIERARQLAEMETIRERENHDLRVNMSLIQAKEQRESTIAAIQTTFAEASRALESALNHPNQIALALGFVVTAFLGLFASRESVIFARKQLEIALGRPALVRETSRSKSASMFPSRRSSAGSLQDVLRDVVLDRQTLQQVERVANSTRAAHQLGAPLRHIMLHGPPGTGKTMVAKRLATWCGLDYAIMSGADVAPLKESAVTELHNLFRWASNTRRGVLLFIDEADAFLASRERNMSESLRNSLTTLLYHTGTPSSKIMLVLATNRPHDLDPAVLDRIDESIQFNSPDRPERIRLFHLYYSRYVAPRHPNYLNDQLIHDAAEKTEGYSGREIAKLMLTLQAHLNAMTHASAVPPSSAKRRHSNSNNPSSPPPPSSSSSSNEFADILRASIKQHQQLRCVR